MIPFTKCNWTCISSVIFCFMWMSIRYLVPKVKFWSQRLLSFSQAQMWSSILHVHSTMCIPLHCTCEQYRACYPCENCRFAHRGWQSSCIILQYFCINAVSLFGFIGWEEIFPIRASQQGNKLQQSFQSSTKYWRHQPTAGQNKTRERRGTAKQFSRHELVTARSYP